MWGKYLGDQRGYENPQKAPWDSIRRLRVHLSTGRVGLPRSMDDDFLAISQSRVGKKNETADSKFSSSDKEACTFRCLAYCGGGGVWILRGDIVRRKGVIKYVQIGLGRRKN